MSWIVKQLTVYADVTDDELLDCITACAKTVCREDTHLVTWHTLARALDDGEVRMADDGTQIHGTAPLLFLREWRKEEGNVSRAVHGTVPLMQLQECFITTSQDIGDGEVTYAVYRREMPVLCLHEGGNVDTTPAPSASHIDALRALLVRRRRADETAQTAIERFFATMHAETGNLVAVECPVLSTHRTAATCAVNELCREALERLCTTRFATAIGTVGETTASPQSVVYLDGDGNPLHAWLVSAQAPSQAAEVVRRDFDLPKPRTRFADVLTRLSATATDTTKARQGTLSAADVRSILQGNPHLPGALVVLNRYEHRGLLRYLLHTGCLVVYGNHYIETLTSAPGLPGRDDTVSSDEFTSRAHTLINFEQHWLEMPLPQHTLYLCPQADMPQLWVDGTRLSTVCASVMPDWREQKAACTVDLVEDVVRWLDEVIVPCVE